MQRKFITNLFFLLFLNLLIKPVWIFGIDRHVQNTLGSERYGEYFILFNFSLLLNILLDLGITNFNNRNISQHRHLLNKHLGGIVSLKFLLGLLYAGITLLAALFLNYSTERVELLMLLTINQFLVSFILYLRSNLAGLHQFRTDSILSIVDRLLMIIFCLILLNEEILGISFNLRYFVLAQTLAYALTALIAFAVLNRQTSVLNFRPNPIFMLVILRKSMPYAFLILLMFFYNRMDSVMLDLLLENGELESGIYAQGYRILDAANMIGFLTAGLLLPLFSRAFKQDERIDELTRTALGFLLSISTAVAILCWLFGEEIIHLLYTEGSSYSASVFSVLILSFIPVSMTYLFGTMLTAAGKLRWLNRMAAAGLILNLVLNLIFIPKYGALGSAVTTLITQFTTAVLQVGAGIKLSNVPVQVKGLGRGLVFIAGSYFLGNISMSWDVVWYFQLGAALLGIITLAFLSRMIDLKAVQTIVKSRNDASVD